MFAYGFVDNTNFGERADTHWNYIHKVIVRQGFQHLNDWSADQLQRQSTDTSAPNRNTQGKRKVEFNRFYLKCKKIQKCRAWTSTVTNILTKTVNNFPEFFSSSLVLLPCYNKKLSPKLAFRAPALWLRWSYNSTALLHFHFKKSESLPPSTNALSKHFILPYIDLQLQILRHPNDSLFLSRKNLNRSEEIKNIDKTHC